ncbi:hypothetical protein [Ideonella azotifigens]|uniref:hypothetical protein n=1 Tax=Ideonella azotifigens TaxID=513160 RepID=UPI0011429FDB|nr:hypothetical protein [Ideonella azotifigens]
MRLAQRLHRRHPLGQRRLFRDQRCRTASNNPGFVLQVAAAPGSEVARGGLGFDVVPQLVQHRRNLLGIALLVGGEAKLHGLRLRRLAVRPQDAQLGFNHARPLGQAASASLVSEKNCHGPHAS